MTQAADIQMSLNEVLIASSDDSCNRNVDSLHVDELDAKSIVRKFTDNKISLERFLSWNARQGRQTPASGLIDQAQKDRMFRQAWIKKLELVSELFTKARVEHVFIKLMRYPWTLMQDLDVLALDSAEQLKGIKALDRADFSFVQFRLLAHPLKVAALRRADKAEPRILVDFYPGPMWIRKLVCDSVLIFARKRLCRMSDVSVFVPSCEDDLYLVATHGYNHLRFTLADLLHGIDLISGANGFDWRYLFNVAETYGTADAVYLYLRLLEEYSKAFRGQSFMNEDNLEVYEKTRICRTISSWLKKECSGQTEFPVRIPSRIGCVFSSFYHCSRILGRARASDLIYDFSSHYLALCSRAILGET